MACRSRIPLPFLPCSSCERPTCRSLASFIASLMGSASAPSSTLMTKAHLQSQAHAANCLCRSTRGAMCSKYGRQCAYLASGNGMPSGEKQADRQAQVRGCRPPRKLPAARQRDRCRHHLWYCPYNPKLHRLSASAHLLLYVHTAALRTSQPLFLSSAITSASRPMRSLPASSNTVEHWHGSTGEPQRRPRQVLIGARKHPLKTSRAFGRGRYTPNEAVHAAHLGRLVKGC